MATMNRPAPGVLAPSPFARLGLAPGASPTDIKRAYRRLVMALHPDLAGDGSLGEFLAVKTAYESLLAHPRDAMSNHRRAPSAGRTVVDRSDHEAGPRPAAARTPEPRGRATGWAGGRWYWEGLGANAARRARREHAG
jgi:curved DNA-binding protein CbpA